MVLVMHVELYLRYVYNGELSYCGDASMKWVLKTLFKRLS